MLIFIILSSIAVYTYLKLKKDYQNSLLEQDSATHLRERQGQLHQEYEHQTASPKRMSDIIPTEAQLENIGTPDKSGEHTPKKSDFLKSTDSMDFTLKPGQVINPEFDGKLKSKKIKIRNDGKIFTVESYVMNQLIEDGWRCIFSESLLLNAIWYFLFHDIFWMNVMVEDRGELLPAIFGNNDVPFDFYREDQFYNNRKNEILDRLIHLSENGKSYGNELILKTGRELKASRRVNGELSFKAKGSSEKTSFQSFVFEVYNVIPNSQLLPLLHQLLYNQNMFRRGLPDLFCWKDTGEFMFAEVKSQNDTLSKQQIYWSTKMKNLGIQYKIINVLCEAESKETA